MDVHKAGFDYMPPLIVLNYEQYLLPPHPPPSPQKKSFILEFKNLRIF